MQVRKTEVKKLVALLEKDFSSIEEAAEEILGLAYELYEGLAKWYIVGQVKPSSGWKSPEEGRDSKILLGPFSTEKQAVGAGRKLAYSSTTGEESKWWAVKAWRGSPAEWYNERKKRWQTENLFKDSLYETRVALSEDFSKEFEGAPLPLSLKGIGWGSLAEFQIWLENTEGKLDDHDLQQVIRFQQNELNKLKALHRVS